MSVAGGDAPSMLDTLEFPAALERVAAHAAGPLGAARVKSRRPATDPEAVRGALAQVAELAAIILSDDAVRAQPVPDLGPSLELLAVPGSVLEGPRLVELGRALGAARVTAADLARLASHAPRTATLRVEAPPKELEKRLTESLDADGAVLDSASRALARGRQNVREARQRLIAKLAAILGGLDQSDRAPDAAVTVRGGRYVIPIRATARSHVGGIVHDESATRSTLFVEPPEVIELGNELRRCEAEEQREVLRVLRELSDLVRPHRDAIAAAWEMCIAFDDLCARARYAAVVNGFAPAIGTGPLAIRQGRHPLLISAADPLSTSAPVPVPTSIRVESSPPVPLSVPERGDVASSPSPEGRGGQGVRTHYMERGTGRESPEGRAGEGVRTHHKERGTGGEDSEGRGGQGVRTPHLKSSPPVPLSVPERGDVGSSPSPEGRGGQGVRTLERGDAQDVVPFDLILAPDEYTVLVSGPNTGGKTVLIKAVGLISLMAQSGIIPPIGPQSVLPVFGAVFADIGDRQSIAASLSTFSAHVAALRDILEHAGAGSLVLLDEIGSGTDPAEGGALAAAVLKTLTRRRAVTLATTHLGALKQLATQTVGIVNASLQFDADMLSPTYRLLKGVPGRSYGLAIARRLGVATDVLEMAESAVPEAERALDALLATVEARARDLEANERELAERATAMQDRAAQLEAREADVAVREREVAGRARLLEGDARERARAYLLQARRKVEEALARARAAVDEATAKEARRLVEQAIDETTEETIGQEEPTKGEGWVSLDDLKRARRPPAHKPTARPPDRLTAAVAATEVSLRGLRVDEAEPLLVKALDDAVLADVPYLRVVHGKGTGVLRRLVHDALSADPRVRRFGFAPPNQGGHGVTIVEFGE